MIVPLLALAMIQQAAPPTLDSDTGTYLVAKCRAVIRIVDNTDTNADGPDAQICLSFIDGFIAGMNLLKPSICITGATKGTAARVYVAYMDQNPKYFDRQPAVGLAFALIKSYPCPAK